MLCIPRWVRIFRWRNSIAVTDLATRTVNCYFAAASIMRPLFSLLFGFCLRVEHPGGATSIRLDCLPIAVRTFSDMVVFPHFYTLSFLSYLIWE